MLVTRVTFTALIMVGFPLLTLTDYDNGSYNLFGPPRFRPDKLRKKKEEIGEIPVGDLSKRWRRTPGSAYRLAIDYEGEYLASLL